MNTHDQPVAPTARMTFLFKWTVWLAFMIVLVLFGYLRLINWTPAYSEADVDGYVIVAKRMARFEPLAVVPETMFEYHEHLWVENAEGRVTAKFSPGMPVLMAVFFRLVGDEGVYLVSPLAGLLTLLGAFLLYRRWMSDGAATLAVLAMSLNMVFLLYSGYPLAHSASACFVTWGMLMLMRFQDLPARRRAIAAGLLLGFAVAIRYTAILLAGCVVAAGIGVLCNSGIPRRPRWRAVGTLALAYAFFPFVLMIWNRVYFDAPLTTGYALSDEQGGFSLAVLSGNYQDVIARAYRNFLFDLLPFGMLGMLVLGNWRERAVRWLWLAPISVLYASYYWYQPFYGFFRFYMPVIPLIVGMAYALIDTVRASRSGRYLGLLALTGLSLWHAAQHYQINLTTAFDGSLYRNSQRVATLGRLLSRTVDADAVVFSKGEYVYSVGVRRRFRMFNLTTFTKSYGQAAFPAPREYTLADLKRGAIPPRSQERRAARFREFYRSRTQAQLDTMKRDLVERFLSEGRQVVFVLPDGDAPSESRLLGEGIELMLLASAPLTDDVTTRPGEPVRQWHVFEAVRRAD